MTKSILKVNNLKAGYGESLVLQGINMDIQASEIVGVIGRNGVGKTTFLKCLIGIIHARSGQIELDGLEVSGMPSHAIAELGVGYVPQGRGVFPRMTVAENLVVGELIGGKNTKKQPELVYEYFPILAKRRNQLAGTMSGGEQQQLAIGRVLNGNPKLMLLDEPSEGIQPSIVQLISYVLKKIKNDLGTTIVFVEQNLDTILALAERCYVMEKGFMIDKIESGQVNKDSVRKHLLI